jgi:hypothetical protein
VILGRRLRFIDGATCLDSVPVTGGVDPFNLVSRNRLQIRDLHPSHWSGRRECHPRNLRERTRRSNEQLPTRFREGRIV